MKHIKLFENFKEDIVEDIKFILLDIETDNITLVESYKDNMFVFDLHSNNIDVSETANLRLKELGYFIFRTDETKDNKTTHLLIISYDFLNLLQKENIQTIEDITDWEVWKLSDNVRHGKINYTKNGEWVFYSILDGKKSRLQDDEVEVYSNIDDDDELRFRSLSQANFYIIYQQCDLFNI
jgi:hypothetical protein